MPVLTESMRKKRIEHRRLNSQMSVITEEELSQGESLDLEDEEERYLISTMLLDKYQREVSSK